MKLNPLTAVTVILFLLLLAFLFCLMQPSDAGIVGYPLPAITVSPTTRPTPEPDPVWPERAFVPIVMKGER